ncbi:hypothetical protein B4U84_28700 [Westiellopsis prolifica IICB1]|nr:hypothetical protein B4U84_28700 [Westiellopsis prolifica IICB1]
MNNNTTPTYRCFHPLIADAYTAVHQWLETNVQEANGYKDLPYSNLKQKLQETDWKHIAFQYYALFPAHYFKAVHTLDYILGEEQLITWLRHRQKGEHPNFAKRWGEGENIRDCFSRIKGGTVHQHPFKRQ